MNPESEYYFDWHAQIDNPVATLDNAAWHLIADAGAFPYSIIRRAVALLFVLSVNAEQ